MDLTSDPSGSDDTAASGPAGRDDPTVAGSSAAKRVGPVVAMVAIVWLLKKLFGRSRS